MNDDVLDLSEDFEQEFGTKKEREENQEKTDKDNIDKE